MDHSDSHTYLDPNQLAENEVGLLTELKKQETVASRKQDEGVFSDLDSRPELESEDSTSPNLARMNFFFSDLQTPSRCY